MEAGSSPWRTEEGRHAMENWMALLARGEGDIADFARDVVAGRAKPHDLLYSSYLSEQTLAALHEGVDRWQALPAAEQQAAIATAEATTRAEIAALAALDPAALDPTAPEPARPTRVTKDDDEDSDDYGAGFMKDSW